MATTGILRPDGDGFHQGWADAGNVFTNVNEAVADDDTTTDDFDKDLDAAAARLSYTIDESSIPAGATIDSILITFRWRKQGGGPDGELNVFVRVGTTDFDGVTKSAGVTYQTDTDTIVVAVIKADIEIGVREGSSDKDLRLTQIFCDITFTPVAVAAGIIRQPSVMSRFLVKR